MALRKFLIANRGEIALDHPGLQGARNIYGRVLLKADESSLHVKLADEAICIGPPAPRLSYLNMSALLTAADLAGADAIHPGWISIGNSEFARLCGRMQVHLYRFRAPKQIALMGEKTQARRIAREANVPLLRGHCRH